MVVFAQSQCGPRKAHPSAMLGFAISFAITPLVMCSPFHTEIHIGIFSSMRNPKFSQNFSTSGVRQGLRPECVRECVLPLFSRTYRVGRKFYAGPKT